MVRARLDIASQVTWQGDGPLGAIARPVWQPRGGFWAHFAYASRTQICVVLAPCVRLGAQESKKMVVKCTPCTLGLDRTRKTGVRRECVHHRVTNEGRFGQPGAGPPQRQREGTLSDRDRI